MDEKTMKKALEATARVACCSFLIGAISCQAKKEPSASEQVLPQSVEKTEVTAEEAKEEPKEVPKEVPKEEQAPLIRPSTIDYPDALMSCVEHINKELLIERPQTVSDKAISCCHTVATHVIDVDGHVFNWELGDVCCSVMDEEPMRSACTPWGPPMPPKMSFRKSLPLV
ncbi:MAG: hypothetical protein CMK59_14850 [Proteobacteria bacterium]|nr:hypothetical protein [Pseudomonadota bacterium]